MFDAPLEVMFARLEGKLDALTQTVELRITQNGQKAQVAAEKAKAAHQRLDEEGAALRQEFSRDINQIHEIVNEMQRWQSRMIGIGIGIGAMSGVVSALVVLLLSGSGG